MCALDHRAKRTRSPGAQLAHRDTLLGEAEEVEGNGPVDLPGDGHGGPPLRGGRKRGLGHAPLGGGEVAGRVVAVLCVGQHGEGGVASAGDGRVEGVDVARHIL